MLTAQMPGATAMMSGPTASEANIELMRSLALHIAMSTRLPRAASARASAAETVVLPTPPLPVTKMKRRSSALHMVELRYSITIAVLPPDLRHATLVLGWVVPKAPGRERATDTGRGKRGRDRTSLD